MHYALSMRRLCAACGATGPSGGMADAEVSKTSDFGRVSSSLTSGTTFFKASGAKCMSDCMRIKGFKFYRLSVFLYRFYCFLKIDCFYYFLNFFFCYIPNNWTS